MKNESGYTLLAVLLIIVVIGFITPPLMNNVLSSSLQNDKTEEQVQLENLTDMGKNFFRNQVSEEIAEIGLETNYTLDEIKNTLTPINDSKPITLSSEKGNQQFQVGYESIYQDGENIIIEYVSRAIVNGSILEEKEEYYLKFKQIGDEIENQPPPSEEEPSDPGPVEPAEPSEGLNCLKAYTKNGTIKMSGKDHCILRGAFVIPEDLKLSGQAKVEVYGSIVFGGKIDITGSPSGYLNIEGSAQFQNNVTVKGNGKIDIQGDGVFVRQPSRKGNGSIKINGQEYKK